MILEIYFFDFWTNNRSSLIVRKCRKVHLFFVNIQADHFQKLSAWILGASFQSTIFYFFENLVKIPCLFNQSFLHSFDRKDRNATLPLAQYSFKYVNKPKKPAEIFWLSIWISVRIEIWQFMCLCLWGGGREGKSSWLKLRVFSNAKDVKIGQGSRGIATYCSIGIF